MNKHELFDLIGEADEDYVNAADAPAKRARPRWRTWVACAACAALIIGAYPAYRALAPTPLHSYTVVEGAGGAVTPHSGSGAIKTPYQEESTPEPDAPEPDAPEPNPVPNQLEALAQYDALVRNGGISGADGGTYPDWYGGCWMDNDWPDNTARLTVAIAEGYHTPELEAQIIDWCGGTGEILFADVKYSYNYLLDLQERLYQSEYLDHIPGTSFPDVSENCVKVDLDTPSLPEDTLAWLAELDPDGDAIQLRLFTGAAVSPDLAQGPVSGGAQDKHSETPSNGTEAGMPPRGSGPDAPVEEGPYNQYNSLFENAHLDKYPEWYGGAYNNYEDGVPVRLAVCIVDGFRTPELEAQITDWCGGGELIFKDVKYSRGYLQDLMERMNGSEFLAVTKEDPAVSGWGVYEDENCVRMDCRAVPSDATLAALARLDPDGDAIQVRVFSGQTVNTDIVKGPAPGGAQDDQPEADPDEPSETPPDGAETAAPAQYDAQPALLAEPPEAEYDLLPVDE